MNPAEYGWCGNPRHIHTAHLRMDTCFAFILDPQAQEAQDAK